MARGSRIKISIGDRLLNCIYDGEVSTQLINGSYRRRCYFICECGNRFISYINDIKSGHTKSCGCSHSKYKKHGMAKEGRVSSEYHTYQNMIARCYNPLQTGYKNYGGRGITVCDRWLESFENFFEDMGFKPSPAHSINRIKNELGYSKENCEWATQKEQMSNTRRNLKITFNGLTKTVTDWSIETGIDKTTLAVRYKKGMDMESVFYKGHLQQRQNAKA